MTTVFVGVMSGTSLDGADAVVAEFGSPSIRTLAAASVPFDGELRSRLLRLCEPGKDELDEAGEVSAILADRYAEATYAALSATSLQSSQITAIGCHGQTIRHRPGRGYSIQLNHPARLAELTRIDVVADFRSRDIAAGGQGAPLVPVFHHAAFRSPFASRAIVNIGGISNVTFLRPSRPASGFDCGPGNILMDGWARRHLGADFDRDGEWAAGGKVLQSLLDEWLDDPYFHAPPPKSTGREKFNSAWFAEHVPRDATSRDVQASLLELTASTIARAISDHGPDVAEVFVCGGGAHNAHLLGRLAARMPERAVSTTHKLGIPPEHVEAAAFAWLAMKCIRREPVDLENVTGARGPRILGAVYPA